MDEERKSDLDIRVSWCLTLHIYHSSSFHTFIHSSIQTTPVFISLLLSVCLNSWFDHIQIVICERVRGMSSSSIQAELLEHVRALEKSSRIAQTAAESSTGRDVLTDTSRTMDIIDSITRMEGVSADDLRCTKAGLIIAKLSKTNANDQVASAAKTLLAKWKAAVLPSTTAAKPTTTTVASPSSSPSPSPPSVKKEETKEKTNEKEKESKVKDEKEKEKEKKRKSEKEAAVQGNEKKKIKSESSPSASPSPPSSSSSSSSDASSSDMAKKYPDLAHGILGLFKTNDNMRDKVQYMLWEALGEPSQKVRDAQEAARSSQAVAADLSSYKEKSHNKKEESNTNTTTAAAADTTAEAAAPAVTATPSSPAIAPTSSSSSSSLVPMHSFHTRSELALKIEAEMHTKWKDSSSQSYRQKIRDLAPQLKDPRNQDLNDDLYLGILTPNAVVESSSKDLASAEFKAKRDKEAAYNREAARCDLGLEAAASDIFQCDICKNWKCTYFQMQTRGADEPMTIFCTCLICGNKFRSGDGER